MRTRLPRVESDSLIEGKQPQDNSSDAIVHSFVVDSIFLFVFEGGIQSRDDNWQATLKVNTKEKKPSKRMRAVKNPVSSNGSSFILTPSNASDAKYLKI